MQLVLFHMKIMFPLALNKPANAPLPSHFFYTDTSAKFCVSVYCMALRIVIKVIKSDQRKLVTELEDSRSVIGKAV